MKYPTSLRKIIYKKIEDAGVIIGQTTRYEGIYYPGDYEEPSYIQRTITCCFWIVATGMNKTVLVPKDSEFKIS
jgi:hypothetical protein